LRAQENQFSPVATSGVDFGAQWRDCHSHAAWRHPSGRTFIGASRRSQRRAIGNRRRQSAITCTALFLALFDGQPAAADYITRLPKTHQHHPTWQAAVEALILVTENNGPTMFARIGVTQALNRHHVREFNPNHKEPRWGKRKLKSDQ
jgi:hypothetical protein